MRLVDERKIMTKAEPQAAPSANQPNGQINGQINGQAAGRAARRRRPAKPQPDVARSLSNARIIGRGGMLNPLDDSAVSLIHNAALTLLSKTGMANPPTAAIALVEAAGGQLDARQRLLFPEKLVMAAIDAMARDVTLYGRRGDTDLRLSENRVHVGTGGASPMVYDSQLLGYRESKLQDIYDAARLVDTLHHIHFFSRPLVARDMAEARLLDVNTAYACLAGTQKHVFVSASTASNVRDIASLCYKIAGSPAAFRERPFLSLNVNHVVPPLRFDEAAIEVMIEAVRCGIPVMVNTFGQLGASSPVTIAGCVAQTMAETLAGMIIAWLVDPAATAVFGPRPMVTDLRTGAMAGGSGEQAALTAASLQMARHYRLPSSTIAGATDSKIADAQSGYEKCITVSQTVQAGANIITQACGAQAGLMGMSFESLVIDNDMLGCILRSTAAIEISPEIVSADAIDAVATGVGHFLGEADTYARMHSDFLYPALADRSSIEVWETAGSPDIRDKAAAWVDAVLHSHYPFYIDPLIDAEIRATLPIKLDRPQDDGGVH